MVRLARKIGRDDLLRRIWIGVGLAAAISLALGADSMNEYVRHVGSGIFAVPPGAASGNYVGAGLFG